MKTEKKIVYQYENNENNSQKITIIQGKHIIKHK